ncbi:MAG: transglutaminase-like domain-containing protein [Candidatus Pseudobacter hemicellulosilyticus]|uniref:Transglutaminase-like domain-containing protein n=1 Tax=Candidatus Pseudobacter hemicellulosilyticus TaxID=3121375 RepID=A0AAJ6BFZ6_9BACT|nr:MAG: transglutaminase-like domain-containing protein [Pseudobacter sp.]
MRTRILTSLLMVLLPAAATLAQAPGYDTASIPASLKQQADVVKRYERIIFEVTDIDRAHLTVHQVFTVLNHKGSDVLFFREDTDEFNQLGDVEIRVYDAQGRQTARYRKKDLSTVAVGEGLVANGKASYYRVNAPGYPITVEYIFDRKLKGTLTYPTWYIQEPGQNVMQCSFVAKVPKALDLRFKARNISLTPRITEDDKYRQYEWGTDNLAPVQYEEGSISFQYSYPTVSLAPNRFRMDDYEGDMRTWENFGRWYGSLKKGVDLLSPARKAVLAALVKDARDDEEKVRILYRHLQQNFRYVNINLGIGGWKPISAEFTDQNKYGDCKALSNFMQTALEAIGITSYQALVNSQYNFEAVDPAFPCNEFNHVILCVPRPKDSIWLECTSRTIEFGVLGSDSENKNALLITPNGGVLVPTPRSSASSNSWSTNTTIILQEDGSGSTNTLFRGSGAFKEQLDEMVHEKLDDQKKFLVFGLGFKQPDEFLLKSIPDSAAYYRLQTSIEKIPEFTAGSKMFLSPRPYKLRTQTLPKAEGRKEDYYFYMPFIQKDTTRLQLPAGFKQDALPKPRALQCKYGSYTTQYWYDEATNSIYTATMLQLTEMKIPAADYAAVRQFFDEVRQDDAQRIVIRKD